MYKKCERIKEAGIKSLRELVVYLMNLLKNYQSDSDDKDDEKYTNDAESNYIQSNLESLSKSLKLEENLGPPADNRKKNQANEDKLLNGFYYSEVNQQTIQILNAHEDSTPDSTMFEESSPFQIPIRSDSLDSFGSLRNYANQSCQDCLNDDFEIYECGHEQDYLSRLCCFTNNCLKCWNISFEDRDNQQQIKNLHQYLNDEDAFLPFDDFKK